ncbi:MAG: penicillin acylase family protein [Myxococcota bacterium]
MAETSHVGDDRKRGAGAGRAWGTLSVAVGLGALAIWGLSTLQARDAERAAHPQVSGRLALPGLEQGVRIDRDRHGVPHIEAETEADAFFALGFVHAQDRLGQLIALRRLAYGTRAGHEGPAALDADRLARLMDFRGLAEAQWGNLPRASRRVLSAYAAGVNARLERVRTGRSAPPPQLAGETLEPWRPQDSLALYKQFAWSLSASIDASLVLRDLVERLGAPAAGRFFPPRELGHGPAGRTTADGSEIAPWVVSGVQSLRRALGAQGMGVGSTAFVLAGRHTESGKPMLVADSHFEPTAPARLYLAQLRGPGLDIAGAGLPGVPVFWWGRNGHLAWAAVNAGAVVTDLYVETLRKEGAEYHDGRRWREIERRTEVVEVRGAEPATLEVRTTRRGPLLPSEDPGAPAVAVHWSGARVDGASGIASLLGVARSVSGEGVREALTQHHEPPIALVWAESSGEAGLQMAGWIPERSLAPQLLPLPGRARLYAWDSRIAAEALPSASLLDGQGFLVAADQRFESAAAGGPIDAMWRTGTRAGRLTKLLSQAVKDGAALKDLIALQDDVTLERSRDVVEIALDLVRGRARGEEASELVRLLSAWDGRAEADSTGSAVYHVFLDTLAESLFAEGLGPDLYERYLQVPGIDLESLVFGVLLDAAQGDGPDGWSARDAVVQAIESSLRETWLALSFRLGPDPRRWSWGRIHTLQFRSMQRRVASLGPFAAPGAPHAIRIASFSAARPFEVSIAPVARFAVDAGALDLALTLLAPGQSEHPGHAHYADAIEDWQAGRLRLLATRRLEVDDRSVAQLQLDPVR